MTPRLALFDSGVGGFTVLKRVLERHSNASCLYLGDTARLPYGRRSPSEIRFIAREVVEWLRDQAVSAVLISCNTTNSLAFDVVEDLSGVPVFGLISSAVEMISSRRIGVLATPATVSSKAYAREIRGSISGAFVLEQECPAFVPMIETGQLDTDELRSIACEYLSPLLESRVEEIVLGCSHYPLLEPLLKDLLPKEVRLIDPATALVKKVDHLIGSPKFSLQPSADISNTRFCVTSDPSGFATRAMHWLGNMPQVELVSLRSKACVF